MDKIKLFIILNGLTICFAACSKGNNRKSTTPDNDDTGTAGTDATAIDLGLSTKWASCNVGASKPEEFGVRCGWGDPTGSYSGTDLSYYGGTTPPTNISGTKYDIAHVQWGGKWRTPTYDEINELFKYCTWEWSTYNGVYGETITSNKNGNSIFLPATGNDMPHGGKEAFYWSSTNTNDDINSSYLFAFESAVGYNNSVWDRYIQRSFRCSIRPVCNY